MVVYQVQLQMSDGVDVPLHVFATKELAQQWADGEARQMAAKSLGVKVKIIGYTVRESLD